MDFQMVLRMKIESEEQPNVVQLSFRDLMNTGIQFTLVTTPENAAPLRVKRLYNFSMAEAPAEEQANAGSEVVTMGEPASGPSGAP